MKADDGRLRAMTLWQPWASLVAEGVKTIETRPKRSPWSSAVGETIAIHAAAKTPGVPDPHGYIGPYDLGYWAEEVRHVERCDCDFDDERVGARCMANSLGVQHMLFAFEGEWAVPKIPLPLGAIVATCTLVDVVPMVDDGRARNCLDMREGNPTLALRRDDGPIDPREVILDVRDQRPFGDFAPGRFALLLGDVQKCVPVPCRGYQGLWRVPDDVVRTIDVQAFAV